MSAGVKNSPSCNIIAAAAANVSRTQGVAPSVEKWEAILIILGTGAAASLVAAAFSAIRKHVYKDKNTLDTSFDAGGKVNAGLTATTIVSQWTWAATLLQSSTVASAYGISGPLWYAAGATIQILLFAMVSVQLKIRAPGAKTFLQVIRARFGTTTHKVFCVFALMTNVIVTSMLMLGGAAVISSLVKDMTVEFATTLVAATVGAYTFIGGLGATFYVSYFNTAIIYVIMLIFLLKVYGDNSPDNALGSIEAVYSLISCKVGPDGNKDNSYLTILSYEGVMFGLINVVGNFGTVFVDQSYWQSSVAAKPRQGVMGFLGGGLCWFAVPFSLATTMGLAYVALSAQQDHPLLTDAEVNAGLVPPVVAQRLLGRPGEFMILVMVLMAVTSTGSAEIMAVTSILVYDIYGVYLKPYRQTTDANSCLLCGKGRGRMANPRDKCVCIVMANCLDCSNDDAVRQESRRAIKPDYKCSVHGPYRVYLDFLDGLKNWCLVWTTISILPLTVLLHMIGLSLGWLYLFMGVLIGSCVPAIALCMFWERLAGRGMVAGSLGGSVLALVVWLAVASSFPGGLRDFFKNTGKELAMLSGNAVAILSGGFITVLVSLVTNWRLDPASASEIWETTRDIDNPLTPWTQNYAVELQLTGLHQVDNRPSLQEVAAAFKNARYLAYFGSVSLSFLLIVLWPAVMVAVGVMSLQDFTHWVTLSEVWAFVATVLIILVPLLNEAFDVYTAVKTQNKISSTTDVLFAASTNKTIGSSRHHRSSKPRSRGGSRGANAEPSRLNGNARGPGKFGESENGDTHTHDTLVLEEEGGGRDICTEDVVGSVLSLADAGTAHSSAPFTVSGGAGFKGNNSHPLSPDEASLSNAPIF